MILLIDNFDSFTYNIVHAYQQLGMDVRVIRNQQMSVDEVRKLDPQLIVIGPGPGHPRLAGLSLSCILLAEEGIPIFGICLGHQAIGTYFGAHVVRAPRVMQGKTSPIFHAQHPPFTHMPQGFLAARYHSLIVDPATLPSTLETTAWTSEHEIMGIRHRHLPIQGVQFHPESIATERGLTLLKSTLDQTPCLSL